MGVRHNRPPTPKQQAAFMRNWQVRKLRGLWWFLGGHFTGERLAAARDLIDQELVHLGAEKASVRIAREARELATGDDYDLA